MLSNKDIRVENGNLIINGVKYPLDTIEIREEVDALSETVGDETSGLVKDVDDLSELIGDITQTGVTGDSVAEQIEELNDDLTDAIKNTLKYTAPEQIDADVLNIGGVVCSSIYFSINKGCIGLGVCMDAGNADNYLIALLYRDAITSQTKYVELAKNGLYISAVNTAGTAAISGNTGEKRAYTIVFK